MSILGIDIGTTGVKAVAFDLDGRALGSAYREYALESPAPGHMELDPGKALAALSEVVRGAAGAASRSGDPVRTLATSSLGEAAVPMDHQGRALGNGIIGFDARGDAEAEAFRARLSNEEVFAITGHGINSYHTLFKAMWWKDHRPEVFARMRRFLCFGDLALAHLGLPPRIDHSLAARTLAFDIGEKRWSRRILDAAGGPRPPPPPPAPAGAPPIRPRRGPWRSTSGRSAGRGASSTRRASPTSSRRPPRPVSRSAS